MAQPSRRTPALSEAPPSRKAGPWWAIFAALLLSIACQAAAPASAPPPADRAQSPAAQPREAPPPPAGTPTAATATAERYDLGRDEARGGHTLARHVGRSDADLRERLRREQISAASTYTDRATAERVVARTLARQRTKIDQWLARQGSRPNLALDHRGEAREAIGRSLSRRSPQPAPCSDAVVVLRSDGGRGFIVLTSYPEIRR